MKYLKMSAFILLYMAVYFIISNYIGLVFGIFYMIKEIIVNPDVFLYGSSDAFMDTFVKNSVWFMTIAALVSFPIYAFILWLRKQNIFRVCGFSGISVKDMAITVLMGISLNFVIEYLVAITSLNDLSPSVQQMFSQIFDGNSFAVILIAIGIVGPFIEEVIFRGLILNELRRNIPLPAAVIIQAVLFGAYHMNLTQGIYATLLGIILAQACIKMKSIWAPILIHMLFNSTSVVLAKLIDPYILMTYQYFILAGSVILLVFTSILVWRGKKSIINIY